MDNTKKILSYCLVFILGAVMTYGALYMSSDSLKGDMFRDSRRTQVVEPEVPRAPEAPNPNASCDFVTASQPTLFNNSAMPSGAVSDIYKLDLTAKGGDGMVSTLVFDVKTNGLSSIGNEDIYNWKIYGGSTPIKAAYILSTTLNDEIVNLTNSPNGSGLSKAHPTKGIADEVYRVTVEFANYQNIPNGSTKNYTLKASIAGASADDTISVDLVSFDNKSTKGISSLKPATFLK